MTEPDTTARLDALEMHVAHQARIVEDLHAAVAEQWATIGALKRQLGQLTERLEDAEASAGTAPAQKPPHY